MLPEPSHRQVQHQFHAALLTQQPPAGLAAHSPSEIAQRFKVYRNNVVHSLTRALAARFPVVEQLVGTAFFNAMARVYIASAPPENPVLLHWGDSFAAFLDQFDPVAHLPFLGDVARLEYARGCACHAADATPMAADELAVADLETLRLSLHPSVSLLRCATPAVQIWLSHQPGHQGRSVQAGPDHALIGRQPDFTVIVEHVDAGTFGVLAALKGGEMLGHAATIADPTQALALLLRHGLIVQSPKGFVE